MGKHEQPRRARLLPVLGIIVLVAALLAVARFAMANDQTTATDDTPPTTVTSATDDTEASSEPPVVPPDKTKSTDKPDDKAGQGDKKREKRQSSELRDKVQLAADGLAADPATFRVATFNVLGHSHTKPGGNKCCRWANSTARMGWTMQLLRGNNVSVAGLQEYEATQHHTFLRMTGGGWSVYPGLQIGNKGVRNSIAWNNGVWGLVEAHTIPIPYFHGNLVPMPYVLLKHHETGRLAWFINIHNPASVRGPAQHWRDVATAKEIALMNELQAPEGGDDLGIPTFLMGDFNEKAEAFCRVTAGANAQAANGGTTSPCRLPAGHGIDWIFGSTPGVTFSGYARIDGGLADRASDHPFVSSSVTLTGEAPWVE
ncbi:endonuclease/exonuclease/phosphatase family protein [Nocardioides bizhenqiangii]|uniref:Endonuclease/exonuclease/phosphatase family protein n=1 Tax=Nocardioides bizhenqiangii TaxID=3095076 RepID=A0ABZ0ZNV4_9ACTN|nr:MULTISPECIES: endonuclease/exonuclease/phosphatase family protein [unclassified Nocardioides]MDZ5621233.1 endonuclease/exonuclease/phosphatase family protein [Nocardioides sp. HM23]WQQ25489.1 endonuclease/exonuclease/phosphatase family protein [Nocardioides sp. HM61]